MLHPSQLTPNSDQSVLWLVSQLSSLCFVSSENVPRRCPNWQAVIDALRLLGVPVVVYDHLAMANTLMRHQAGHQWVRHVAMSLPDAVQAVALLSGLPPTGLPSTAFAAPGRTSGKVCTLGPFISAVALYCMAKVTRGDAAAQVCRAAHAEERVCSLSACR